MSQDVDQSWEIVARSKEQGAGEQGAGEQGAGEQGAGKQKQKH